jgi:virginiamycin B lyase
MLLRKICAAGALSHEVAARTSHVTHTDWMRRLVPALAVIAALVVPAAAQAAVAEHPLPQGAHPLGIAQGPDGAVWALEDGGSAIDRVAPDGTVARFAAAGYTSLVDATFDLGGRLWFTGGTADRLGRATAGATLGPIGTWNFGPGCEPTGVATAPDGGIWFSKVDCNVVGRIDPASAPNSAHDDFAVPPGTQPLRIATGPDGAMWFTAYGSGRIGRVAADGAISWPVAGGLDRPYDLVSGPDGNLWVTESGGRGAILRVTPSGDVTRFTAGLTPGARPQGITASTDGNLYVAAYGANAIAQVRTDGTVAEIPLRAGAGPRGITAAADGSVWFTANDGGWVGHWTPDPAPVPAPVAAPDPIPQLGKTVVAAPTQGTVRVTTPGSGRSYVLRRKDDIPVGSTVDTRRGRVTITSALPGGQTQNGNFWGGFFKVRQSRSRSLGGMTTLELRGRLTCGTRAQAAATRKRRSLWGSDRGGRYRTRGRNATATVRGTVWRTIDRCDGTLVTVQSGAVRVRDSVRRRTVTVRAGHSYLARNHR